MSEIRIWYVDNDMVIELSAVTDKITGSTIDNGVVVATLYDTTGDPVTGATWPLTIPLVSAGLYRAIVDKAVDVIDAAGYLLKIDLATPGGNDAHWEIPIGGETRTL